MNCPHCNEQIYSAYCRHAYGKYSVYYCAGWIDVYHNNSYNLSMQLHKMILLSESYIDRLLLLK